MGTGQIDGRCGRNLENNIARQHHGAISLSIYISRLIMERIINTDLMKKALRETQTLRARWL